MNHNYIPRIIAMLLVLAMIVVCILLANSGRSDTSDDRLGANRHMATTSEDDDSI